MTENHYNLDLIEEALVFKKAYLYLAFSKGTDDTIVGQWQTTLDQIKQDGTYLKIMSAYPIGKACMTFEHAHPAQQD